MRDYYVYIMASRSRRLYVGVTNELRRRVWQHKIGAISSFTRQYRITRLVYFEQTRDVRAAIAREKQLKRWTRVRKVQLIETHNSGWTDLSVDWFSSYASSLAPSDLQSDRE
jgi:putative endonuclease